MGHETNTHESATGCVTRRTALRTAAVGGGLLAGGVVGTVGATQSRHTLMVAANAPVEYEVTVTGELTPDTESGDFSADSDDSFSKLPRDDLMEITDTTGPIPENAGGTTYLGDRFVVSVPVGMDIRPQGDYDVNVYLNEERIGGAEVTTADPHEPEGDFSVMLTANGPTEYHFIFHELDPKLAPDAGDFSADSDDAVETNADGTVTAADSTGPRASSGPLHVLGDRYVFSGAVEEFDVDADAETDVFVYVDERNVDPADVRANAF